MKRTLLLTAVVLLVSNLTFAGGLLTNTNQSASFLRNFAQGGLIDVSGAYYNPAGLSFLPKDGYYLSLNVQSAYQTRNIDATFNRYTPKGIQEYSNKYEGTASAPVIPSFQAAYKKGDWVISASFAIGGGGGKASYDDGLPMFDAIAMAGLMQNGISPDLYNISTSMTGRQYIYNFQSGLTYKANDWLSVYGGIRMNYLSGSYKGFLYANTKPEYVGILGKEQLLSLELDCGQSGWGVQPVVGVDAKLGKLNLAAKYEFMANLNIENDTKTNRMNGVDDYLDQFKDGVNTPNDVPALLMLAGSYEITPKLRASAEYHYFFDKNAGMANVTILNVDGTTSTHGKQKELTHGTIEWLGGVEYDVSDKLTISGSYQNTNYGLSDNYQSDTSFSCDSYSLGIGAKVKISPRVAVNVGYMWTNYKDYTKNSSNYNGTGLSGTDTYSRTNKVFGASLDFKF